MKETLMQLAKELIACPSITPEDAYCQTIIQKRLRSLGFQCESMFFSNTTNLYARFGDQSPLLLFLGHTDVVPPGKLTDWQSPPFEPTIRENTLYGRGAVDMKGALAAMVIAAENLIHKHHALKGSLAFLITSDEEGDACNGTKRVVETLEARNEKSDYCIVGEPCSNELIGDEIIIGRRGSLHGTLIIHGQQGHIARPHLAKNPIHMSLLLLDELARMSWDEGDKHFPPTSFQISNIHSGEGVLNMIPGHLSCLFNFRFSAQHLPHQLQERVEKILHQYGVAFDLSWKTTALPFLSHQGQLLAVMQDEIQKEQGIVPQLSTSGGTSDGRFIVPTGAEVVELGLSRKTAHHINECVPIDDLITLSMLYERIAERLLMGHA